MAMKEQYTCMQIQMWFWPWWSPLTLLSCGLPPLCYADVLVLDLLVGLPDILFCGIPHAHASWKADNVAEHRLSRRGCWETRLCRPRTLRKLNASTGKPLRLLGTPLLPATSQIGPLPGQHCVIGQVPMMMQSGQCNFQVARDSTSAMAQRGGGGLGRVARSSSGLNSCGHPLVLSGIQWRWYCERNALPESLGGDHVGGHGFFGWDHGSCNRARVEQHCWRDAV